MRQLIVRALALDAPGAAFVADDAMGRVLLALRVALLFAAWLSLVGRDDRAQRALFAVACGLFVGSLAFASLFAPFVLAVIALEARRLVTATPRVRVTSGAFAVVAVAATIASSSLAARPPAPVPDDAPRLTVYWIDRENLFEARFWATQWARAEEAQPGDAQIVLARIDWELGHRAEARALLADVVGRGRSEDARRRARAQLESWGP